MALMMGKPHEALIGAGADRQTAREAAEEVANYNRIGKVESDLVLLKWMLGFNIAMTLAILWRVFST
ncbi:MAG TPA: integrase [Afifellaceae bacterium]|nr:integrase [Afifellaceae bacterium]